MSFQGKKLINDPKSVVTEFIEGLVATYPHMQYLDGFPEVKVVLHADVPTGSYDKVAVISGGGSGHEPAHAGFVGDGMLMAAICGDIFASPPVNSILSGIRAVTGPKGCLLIVKNYTGDRLNFGLAAELAKSEGYMIETVIVGDDCALSSPRAVAGRRGLAGTVLVHKHGEPGVVADMQPLDVLVSHILEQIITKINYVPFTRGSRTALMINGLGATTLMELMIASGKATSRLQMEYGLAIDRVYVGSFMTSLDMQGFSISLMKVDDEILERLDASTTAPYWPSVIQAF